MTRILQGAPFQLSAVALAGILLIAGLIIREHRRRVPGLPEDGEPLTDREREQMRWIEALYADDQWARGNAPRRKP